MFFYYCCCACLSFSLRTSVFFRCRHIAIAVFALCESGQMLFNTVLYVIFLLFFFCCWPQLVLFEDLFFVCIECESLNKAWKEAKKMKKKEKNAKKKRLFYADAINWSKFNPSTTFSHFALLIYLFFSLCSLISLFSDCKFTMQMHQIFNEQFTFLLKSNYSFTN